MYRISFNDESTIEFFKKLNKLNTIEDREHIHKLFGLFCLIHFCYRYYLLFLHRDMFLENQAGVLCITAHGILSLSSLQFHIPSVRNPKKPMIYPEFRLHSICFALRSVICCYLHYFQFHYAYKIAVCFATMGAADVITYTMNKNNLKNGSTMQNMPFDENISTKKRKQITLSNSYCQIGATNFMLHDMNTAFSCIFAIQLAAFLMTLVRKGIISSNQWHLLYGFSLWINVFLYRLKSMHLEAAICYTAMYLTYTRVFFRYRLQKYISWTLMFTVFVLHRQFAYNTISYYLSENPVFITFDELFRWSFIFYFCFSNMYIFSPLLPIN
jgi:hypothetical protein